ncbi:unnamed protein product, partial [marine sediment metagenome]
PTRNITRCGYGQYFDGDNDYISLPEEIHDALAGQDGGYYGVFNHEDTTTSTCWFTDYSSAENYTQFHYDGSSNKWRCNGIMNDTSEWFDSLYTTSVNVADRWFSVSTTWNSGTLKMWGKHPSYDFNIQSKSISQTDRMNESFNKFYVGMYQDG